MYLPGGHSIGRGIASDDNIIPVVKDFVRNEGPEFQHQSEFREMNAASHVAVQKHVQVALVDLKEGKLPSGMYGNATIVNCLSSVRLSMVCFVVSPAARTKYRTNTPHNSNPRTSRSYSRPATPTTSPRRTARP